MFLILLTIVGAFYLIQTQFHIFNVTTENPKLAQSKNFTTTATTTSTSTLNSLNCPNKDGIKLIKMKFTKKDGSEIFYNAEVADTPEARHLGFMFRECVPIDQGMIFIFDADVMNPFWMKDCLIPLDIIFINKDRKVVDIIEAAPPCKEINPKDCPIYGGNTAYRYAVELNVGQVNKKGIQVGDTFNYNF